MRTTNEQYQAIHEAFNQVSEKQQLDEISGMDALHLGLDVAGMVPVFGAAADLTNAALYGARGKKGMAALSLAAALPGVGQAATAGKLATKFGGRVGKVAKSLTPAAAATRKAGKAADAAKEAKKASKVASKEAKQAGKAAIEGGGMFGSAKGLATAGKKAAAAKAAAKTTKAAAKTAKGGIAKAATRGKVYKNILGGPGGTGRYGLARAGVLARGNIAQTYGFNDPKTPAKDVQVGIPFTGGLIPGEGVAAFHKLKSSIMDTLRKGTRSLEDLQLGSFQA
jgi:hypothetical protein